MIRFLAVALAIMLAGLAAMSGNPPLAAQQNGGPRFPAAAVIRGENIRLRLDPSEASEDVLILQRGDEVTITAEPVAAEGLEFYPVEVLATGDAGWVRTLFINPNSIAPLIETEPAPAPEPDPEVAPVPVEEESERPRRNRQNQEEAPPAEEPAAEEAPAEEPAAEEPPAEEPAAEEPAAEEPPTEEPAEEAPAEEVPVEEEPVDETGTISVSGEGTTAADPVALEARRYRVRALVEASGASGFTVELLGPDNFSEVMIEDTVEEPQTWISRTAVTIETAGDYVVQVSETDDPWVVEFLPR